MINSLNILITTQVFPPEVHPSAVIVQELAQAFAAHGLEVAVAAGYPHHPLGQIYAGYHQEWLRKEKQDGFQVIRSWHIIHPSPTIIIRSLVMASQCFGFLQAAFHSPRPNVILSYGPPLMGPLISAVVARFSGAKLATVIYDQFPDIVIESGMLNNSLLITGLRGLERLMYRLSDKIIVLSEGFRRTLIRDKGVPQEKIEVIPVWLDKNEVYPMDRDNSWRREAGIAPEKFVVLYAGTIGLISGAQIVVEAARLLRDLPDILFLFVGEGRVKDEVQFLAGQAGLTNIHFLPFQPRERLSELQAAADVSLVTLAPGRGKTSVPSKVLGYMAAARPVIAAVDLDCDTAETIRAAQCGLVVPPADPLTLAAAVLYCYRRPEVCREAGEAGRRYFLSNFEKEAVLQRYVAVIQQVAAA